MILLALQVPFGARAADSALSAALEINIIEHIPFVTVRVYTCDQAVDFGTSRDTAYVTLASDAGQTDTVTLGAPTTAGAPLSAKLILFGSDRLASLTVHKPGTDGWCINRVEMLHEGRIVWKHPTARTTDPRYFGAYAPEGPFWLDEENPSVPSSALRFSDIMAGYTSDQPFGNMRLEVQTCAAGTTPGTDDHVEVVVERDWRRGGTLQDGAALEAFNLDNPGNDREAGDIDGYALDQHGMGMVRSLALRKYGADNWCFSKVRLLSDGVEVWKWSGQKTINAQRNAWSEASFKVGWGTAPYGDVVQWGYPGLPLRRASSYTFGQGGEGEPCRAPDTTQSMQISALTYQDRCNDGLACVEGKCAPSGGEHETCNEPELAWSWNSAGEISAKALARCNRTDLTCTGNICRPPGYAGTPCLGSGTTAQCLEAGVLCFSGKCQYPSSKWGYGGMTGCTQGSEDCDPCVSNVEGQFAAMARGDSFAQSHDYFAMRDGYEYEPADREFPQFYSPSGSAHIQGFVRLPYSPDGRRYFMGSYGSEGMLYAMRMNTGPWAGGGLTPGAGGEVINVYDAATHHPGGLGAIGRYLLVADGDSRLKNGVSVYRYTPSYQSVELSHKGSIQWDYSAERGFQYVSSVAAVKSDRGDHLMLASSDSRGKMFFILRGELREPESFRVVQRISNPDIPEGSSLITECGTGKVYAITSTAAEYTEAVIGEIIFGDRDSIENMWALYQLTSNGLELKGSSVRPTYSRGYCNARGGASVMPGHDGALYFYCHDKPALDIQYPADYAFQEWRPVGVR